MGIQGSEVAKEAADVVLMDDNFASIVRAIEEGRLVFDNLKKTIAYTLAHLLPEILPVLLTLALGLPAGLTTLQILSIDLFTELAPAISLAYEPAERDIMLRPPRNIATDRLVSAKLLIYAYLQAGVILSIGCFLAYSWVFWSNGLSLSDLVFEDDDFAEGDDDFEGIGPDRQDTILQRARAAWYLTLVIGQLFHLLNLRSIKTSIFKHSWDNSITYFALALTTSLAILFVYVPGLNDFLGAAPVGEQGWVPPIVVGVILTIYNETRAYMARNKPENRCTHAVNW
ncbi:uncharacterized protein MONBRDRAFT_10758 [Monosiga brevicollis MX1]|uniref:Cation-transporting P-type ATPase C-terminal domain-containing protein n=1 Tax=Monosiga brevicollis TaxID=81824 RepID=A9V754_MONBE|nr:uncharacterized protein MONBRDRAFT_10758 [Monosiga brevicollis MX1]EDQ86730.1 predicted protein [Monosiga brevicollis MX1]|eukprot:XP_001748566.1 hypothetical protein [Monosiga brevicollis MX1]